MEDPLLPKNYRGEQRSGCRRVLTIVGFLFLSLAFLYMLVISILSPVLWVNYNSSIAQNSLDASSISFDSLTLRDPTENTLTVDSNVTISQAGKFAATLKSSTVNVLYQGQIFGRMNLPERELKGDNEPTSFTQTSTLTIVDASVFQQASSKLLQGSNVRWRLSGDVTLSVKMGFSLDFALRLEKDVELFGTQLQDVRAYNLRVVQGLDDRLIVSQTQHVLNPSSIAMENMGDLTFEVYVPQIDASQTKSLKRFGSRSPLDGLVKISEVYIPNFRAPRGESTIKNTTAAAIKTGNNVKALENFLSSWNLGKEQSVRLVGPIATSTNSSFLLNIIDIEAVIEGNKHTKIIQGARFGDDETNNPVQTAYNPLDLPVTQSNFNFAVFLTAPFFPNYEGISPSYQLPLTSPALNCVAKPTFGNLTLEGPPVTIPSKGFLNITVTVNPFYKQQCDSFRIWAACCGLYSGVFDQPNGPNPMSNITNRSFQIGTRGTMTTKIGNFSFTQLFQQDAFNMTCGTNTDFFNNICYSGGVNTYCLQSDSQYCDSLINHS